MYAPFVMSLTPSRNWSLPDNMRQLVTALLGILTVLYPVAVYFSLEHLSPRTWGGILLALLALRLWMHRQHGASEISRWSSLAAVLAALWMLAGDSAIAMRTYPVIVNAVLAILFGVSLLHPPSLIERLARLQDPALPESGVIYTRKVTQVWLAFFVLNGSISAYTAFWGTMEQWTLYNGAISYVLMGTLFVVEWLVRQTAMKRANS